MNFPHVFFPLSVWYYFGVVGSFTFILIQLILLIDFAHSWNQSWVQKAEEGNSKCWFGGNGETSRGNKMFCCFTTLSAADSRSRPNRRSLLHVGNSSLLFIALLAALLVVTIINFALAFTAVVLFYVFYTQPDGCTENKVFISLNLIFCIIVSVVSVLPKVQVRL